MVNQETDRACSNKKQQLPEPARVDGIKKGIQPKLLMCFTNGHVHCEQAYTMLKRHLYNVPFKFVFLYTYVFLCVFSFMSILYCYHFLVNKVSYNTFITHNGSEN